MENCFVRNCETDTNVVNTTTLFFVGFPIDNDLKIEWIKSLQFKNYQKVDEIANNAKICSCHFVESDFGKHATYGYKYLLPTAIPSIFPNIKQDEGLNNYYDEFVEETEDVTDTGESNLAEQSIGLDDDDVVTEFIQFNHDKNRGNVDETSGNVINILDANFSSMGLRFVDGELVCLQSIPTENGSESNNNNNEQFEEDNENVEEKVYVEDEEYENEQDYEEDREEIKNFEIVFDGEENEQAIPIQYVEEIIEEGEEVEEEVEEEEEEEVEEVKNVLIDPIGSVNDGHETISVCVLNRENKEEENYIVEIINDNESECGTVDDNISIISSSMLEKKENRFICSFCKKGFSFLSALKKHSFVHTKEKPFQCEHCTRGFSQKINLDIHMRRHTGIVPEKRFECVYCGKKCGRQSELKTHIKKHIKERPHLCIICDERFKDLTTYYAHLKQHKAKDEVTKEAYIEMIAQNENAEIIMGNGIGLNEPSSILAVGEDGLICNVCGKTVKGEKALKRHKKKQHPKIYTCHYCYKQFLYPSTLEKHLRSHTQEKPWECEHCDGKFSQKVNLEIHLKRHGIFVGKHQLSEICSICNKQFTRKSQLENHLRTHSGERPFWCHLCDRTYIVASALAAHMKTHRVREIEEFPSTYWTESFSAEGLCSENEEGEQLEDIEEQL